MPNNQLDPQAVSMAKAIRDTESGGKFDAKGASGEWGAYQFTPATWSAYAREAGVNAVFGGATPEQQNEVAYKKIKQWKDQGYNVGQVASMWNAGAGRPNAYVEGHKGVNSMGVAYDTPAYAEKVAKAYQRIKTVEQAQQKIASRTQAPEEKEDKGIIRKGLEFLFPILEDKPRTALQTVGDLGLSALSVVPGLGVAGLGAKASAVGARTAIKGALPTALKYGTLAKGTAVGYGADVLSNLSEGETGTEALKPGLGTALGFGGSALLQGTRGTKIGKEALDDDAFDKALQIVAPTLTKKNVKEGLKKGIGGRVGSRVTLGQDKNTRRIAESIKDLVRDGTIKLDDTVERKAGAVLDEIGDVATALEIRLKSMEIQPILTPDELTGLIAKTQRNFKESPLLVGDAGKSAKRIFDKFVSFLPKGRDITAIDLLKARKKLDRWMKAEGRGSAFDPRIENAISKGLREIRQGANELIAKKAPDVPVKEMLDRQSALYDALDAIVENSWRDVGTSATGRYFKNHPIQKGLVQGVANAVTPSLIGGYVGSKLTED